MLEKGGCEARLREKIKIAIFVLTELTRGQNQIRGAVLVISLVSLSFFLSVSFPEAVILLVSTKDNVGSGDEVVLL